MYRQGIRMFILGFVLAGLSHVLINYLGSSGAILPNQVQGLRKAMIGLSLLYSWALGLIYFWIAWKHSPRGQRTIKTIKARFSKPKVATKNTTP